MLYSSKAVAVELGLTVNKLHRILVEKGVLIKIGRNYEATEHLKKYKLLELVLINYGGITSIGIVRKTFWTEAGRLFVLDTFTTLKGNA